MSRPQPPFDENSGPYFEHVEGGLGMEASVDDVLQTPDAAEVVATPDMAEVVTPTPENAPVAPEIEPAVLASLNAKYGEQKWERAEQFQPDWRLDLNTREVLNSKGESQTQILEAAGFGVEHRAMIDDLVTKGSHELAPHQTETELVATIARLQADGTITFETYKHVLVKEEEIAPESKVEDEFGGDDDETGNVVNFEVGGLSVQTLSSTSEKSFEPVLVTTENKPAPTSFVIEARMGQPTVIVANETPAPARETFFQRMMAEVRASTIEKNEVAISTEQTEKKIVPKITVEHGVKECAEAAPVVVFKEKKEIAADIKDGPDNAEGGVDLSVSIQKSPEEPVVIESAPEVQVSVVEVFAQSTEVEIEPELIGSAEIAEKDIEVVSDEVTKKTEIAPVKADRNIEKTEISEPVQSVEKKETNIIAEVTHEQIVAAETGISLESENNIEKPLEINTETNTEKSVVAKVEVPVEVVAETAPAVKSTTTAERQEIQLRVEEIGIELVEVDQEATTPAAEEPVRVQRDTTLVRFQESVIKLPEAVVFGIELVEEVDEVVAETAVVHAEVANEKTEAMPVFFEKVAEQKEVRSVKIEAQDVVNPVVTKEKIADVDREDIKPEVIVSKIEDVRVQAEQKQVVEAMPVVVERVGVEKTSEVVAVKPIVEKTENKVVSIPEKTTVTIKSKEKSEVVRKKQVSSVAETAAVIRDDTNVETRSKHVVDVPAQKNNHELVGKRNPGVAVLVSEDDENGSIKGERGLTTFEVMFA